MSPTAPPPEEDARLLRRLAAIEAALADPRAAALRLLRLRARGAIKTPALAFLKVPGRTARPIAGAGEDLLLTLNAAVFEATARRAVSADTS